MMAVAPAERRWRRTALALALPLLTSLGLHSQGVRLQVSPDDVLVDEPVRISVDGLAPGQYVTIRADGNRGQWRSSATFRGDAQGRVEVADPMRLVWSATRNQPPASPPPAVQPWTFSAEVGGRVLATHTITRRAMAAGVRAVPVRERGLVATAYLPAHAGRHPAILVLPGSQGGLPAPNTFVGGLATRGYVVLAVAYFNAEGLPPLLQSIPLEYFATAVAWLTAQPEVDPARIGVLGT